MINWIESVTSSIPDHSKNVSSMLTKVMTDKSLNEIDAHGCALTAALISGNGELAFAIEMFGPLAKAKTEINLAKTAASSSNMLVLYHRFKENTEMFPLGIEMAEVDHIDIIEDYVCKYSMYALAASVVNYSNNSFLYIKRLQSCGVSVEAIKTIAKIASVINTIGKIAPEVNQLVSSKG